MKILIVDQLTAAILSQFKLFSKPILLKVSLVVVLCFAYQPYIEAGSVKKWVTKKLTPKPSLTSYSKISSETTIVAYKDAYKQCKATVLPSFINNSMIWASDKKYKYPLIGEVGKDERRGETAYRGLQALTPYSVIVTAAGNDHPQPVSSVKTRAAKNFNAIIVGSLSPSGNKSQFSQEGEAVFIMAPSDHYLTSANDDGRYRRYGGTSGAAPLVTAGLAGFEWLSGYHPTAQEAKILLEKTAIPTQYIHDVPRKNGVGMLNAYKLGRVGKEMKRLCGRDIACFKKMIRNPAVYNFPEDSDLSADVDQAFPECSRTCAGHVESCVNKAAVFKRLRKASFLNPSNKKLWTYLACIYNSGGFMNEAEAMLKVYKSLFGPPQNDRPAHTLCQNDSDCTLIPSYCPSQQKQIASTQKLFRAVTHAEAEIHYASRFCKNMQCNLKCRCSNEEKSPSSDTTYSSRCVNSRCVPESKTQVPEPVTEVPVKPVEGVIQPLEESGGRR